LDTGLTSNAIHLLDGVYLLEVLVTPPVWIYHHPMTLTVVQDDRRMAVHWPASASLAVLMRAI